MTFETVESGKWCEWTFEYSGLGNEETEPLCVDYGFRKRRRVNISGELHGTRDGSMIIVKRNESVKGRFQDKGRE